MTQNIDHAAPLKPGEIRRHRVGQRTFQVMHVAGGRFTQATYRDTEVHTVGPVQVIMTDNSVDAVLRAYAHAIEQAESDMIDRLDDADQPSFTAAGAFVPQGGADPMDDSNLPMGASRTLVTGEAAPRADRETLRAVLGEVLDILGDAAEAAADQYEKGVPGAALVGLAASVDQATALIAPYAGGMPPLPTHMLIVLSNGSTLRTTQNVPGDLAGLINAGEAKIYQVADLEGVVHHLVVNAILDFYTVDGV